MCPRIILKCQKVKKLKTTLKLSKLIKMNDYTVLSYTLADNNLKRNFKKFPFNNINMNKTLCHGIEEGQDWHRKNNVFIKGHWKRYQNIDTKAQEIRRPRE